MDKQLTYFMSSFVTYKSQRRNICVLCEDSVNKLINFNSHDIPVQSDQSTYLNVIGKNTLHKLV